MNNSTNNTICSEFDTMPYVIVALISSGTALISVFACTGVILLVVLFKKYYFFTQRMILYLSIAALLNSIAIALRLQRVAYFFDDKDSLLGLCIFTGFMDQTTAWSEVIAISCITFNLLLKAVFHKPTEKLEIPYFILIFILPVLFNWIPFIDKAYGRAGAWCWIRSRNRECKRIPLGYYSRFILWYVPAYVILVLLVLTYIFILYKVRKQRHLWEGRYDPETKRRREQEQKEVQPLLWYPLIFLILNIFPLINRIYDSTGNPPILALWILHAIFSPLKGGFIAVVYTLDKETRKRLNCTQIKAALCGDKTSVSEYPVRNGFSDSLSSNASSEGDGSKDEDRSFMKHEYNSMASGDSKESEERSYMKHEYNSIASGHSKESEDTVSQV